ncbi:hypothetical protein AB0C52_24230 [Streptomyces sp. NPDC048717]|uniref:hypothetical protein n=1 Tax=Streptomyces sp. NPDC048717 TaxID=3154928 RepID=UPI00342D46C9
MVGIHIGTGAALPNMVDLHDQNHRHRTRAHRTVGAVGVQVPGRPDHHRTVTAGVRIGVNTLVGANAVVSRSIAPDAVTTSVPATPAASTAPPRRARTPAP